jgi:hypothetical protein
MEWGRVGCDVVGMLYDVHDDLTLHLCSARIQLRPVPDHDDVGLNPVLTRPYTVAQPQHDQRVRTLTGCTELSVLLSSDPSRLLYLLEMNVVETLGGQERLSELYTVSQRLGAAEAVADLRGRGR